jgi:hypothetical protein
MAIIDLSCPLHSLKITSSGTCSLDDSRVLTLLSLVKDMNTIVLIDDLIFKESATPNLFDYKIVLKDTRQWKQTIDFSTGTGPNTTHTFNVNDGWKLSEYAPQRAIRDLLIVMKTDLGISDLKFHFY